MNRWRKSAVFSVVVLFLITPIPGIIPIPADDPLPTSAYYDPDTDTIHVSGIGNTLMSVAQDVNQEEVIYHDATNETTFCYANMNIEGYLDVMDETLYMGHGKTLRVDSTGSLNITRSVLHGIPEEKYWWESDNRYALVMEDGGYTGITRSHIMGLGYDNTVGRRGFEVYGGRLNMTDTVLSNGRNGLVFHSSGDMDSSVLNNLTVKAMADRGLVMSGTYSRAKLQNSTFYGNRGVDFNVGNTGDLTVTNSTFQDWDVTGALHVAYIQDFYLFDQDGPVGDEPVEIQCIDTGETHEYATDGQGRLRNIAPIWMTYGSTGSTHRLYALNVRNRTVYFSPSSYNYLSANLSVHGDVFVSNVSADPISFVPVNNDWEPHNITLGATVHNHLTSNYTGNLTFYYGDIILDVVEIHMEPGNETTFTLDWVPDVSGYDKIRGEIDHHHSLCADNLKAWSSVFFAGYYNETVVEYEDHMAMALMMAEYGVANEDGDGHYTIYSNWLPDVLMEIGLGYLGTHHVTGNGSYLERGEKQIAYALSFRDQYGLFNRSTEYLVRGNYATNYHEWTTHQNVRSALALQQAYLYTGNESYREFYDHVIDFLLNRVAMVNITYHGGVNYTLPWESTLPNQGEGGEKGTSKNFPFVFVNGYIQLARLLVQAYFDENLNSSYLGDGRLLPHIYTSVDYILNDQIDSGESRGTWAYFSYYDEPNPHRRRAMHYAALTASELANVNSYLNWKNVSSSIGNYTEYIERHLTVRTAIDTNNGGSGMLITYIHARTLYNTTGRDHSHIEAFMFSNVFFNDNGTFKHFRIDTEGYLISPENYGFLYLHYNPFRYYIWGTYNMGRRCHTHTVSLDSGWNFISVPVVPGERTLTDILDHPEDGLPGDYDKVMYFDAEADEWRSHVPGRPDRFNGLCTWDHRIGIWINVTSPANLTVTGYKPYRTWISLVPGWNMVGLPSESAGNHGLPVEVTVVGYFDGTAGYDVAYDYDPANFIFEPGNGYWIYNGASQVVYWIVDH